MPAESQNPSVDNSQLAELPNKAHFHPLEISVFLGISRTKIYQMLHNREISWIEVGKGQVMRIPRGEFIEWYKAHRHARGWLS